MTDLPPYPLPNAVKDLFDSEPPSTQDQIEQLIKAKERGLLGEEEVNAHIRDIKQYEKVAEHYT